MLAKLTYRAAFVVTGLALSIGCGGQMVAEEDADGVEGVIAEQMSENDFMTMTQTAAEKQVFDLINQARKQARTCGTQSFAAAPALTADDRLDRAARLHSQDMATYNYFSHTGRDGSKPWDRITRQGYNWSTAGENIAAGYSTPAAAVAGWLKSPGHCANIMNPRFTQTGVGLAQGGSYRYYWTQVFARPR